MKKTMLITGAAGFIGHFLVKEFCDDYNVICMIRPMGNTDRLKDYLDKVKIIQHNLSLPFNPLMVDDVDVILHAGGNPSSAISIDKPIQTAYENVLGTVHMLELARAKKVEHFVFYGAAESYGQLLGVSEPESSPYDCYSPYAASKASGSEFTAAYSRSYGIKASVINIANTFGERCQEDRFPIVAMKKILAGENVPFYSANGVGSGRRWFHAHDVALHTRFILDNQKEDFEKWNSSGREFMSNLVFANQLAKVMQKPLKWESRSLDPNSHAAKLYSNNIDPDKLYFNGYKEKYSFEERLSQMWEWYKMSISS